MARLCRRCPRGAGRVYPMTRQQWLDAATSQIRFPPDRKRVRQELDAHMEDRLDAARAQGMTAEDAESHALAAMGDPAIIAPELGRLHSPWLGRLWWTMRAVTIAALIVTFLALTDSSFGDNYLGHELPSTAVPPEQQIYGHMVYSRTGLWEDLDLGTVSGYHFQVPVAYVQRLEVRETAGYETYSMELQLLASTWRLWEPWEPDINCISITDNTGCTYLPGDASQSTESFVPYFYLSATHNGPGRSGMNLYLNHMPQTPEWLEFTIGDAILHIDLQGGGGV